MPEINVETTPETPNPETPVTPDESAPLTEDERRELETLRAEKDAPIVPVSEQKAAGVASGDTVTVADQKAGAAVPDLSESDRAELARYRAADQTAASAKAKEDAPLPDTHWLNLADGTTVTAQGTATHIGGVPVLHCTPIPADLLDGGDPNAQAPHRF